MERHKKSLLSMRIAGAQDWVDRFCGQKHKSKEQGRTMRLVRYQVKNFRSVKDSGWIDAGEVTGLIGVNESGKTNLLLPLWKFNPARDGEIQPTSDYPKRMFGDIRANPSQYSFINADFETGELASTLAQSTLIPVEQLNVVRVSRYYDERYVISFPNYVAKTEVAVTEVIVAIQELVAAVDATAPMKQEEGLKGTILEVAKSLGANSDGAAWRASKLSHAVGVLKALLPETPAKTSTLVPRLRQTLEIFESWLSEISAPPPEEKEGVFTLVVNALPTFVYYSNYGNLDSEIYLPHVVANLERDDLGSKEAAKSRTLRVLFSFVRLSPKEILELGRDFKDSNNREPTPAEIAAIAEKKRERSILLQSAGATLTDKFKSWWKQGDYRFRFEADGNHFRIWVSDGQRPEEVELETRSTGLQWFLSFFLVFLVESQGDHEDAVLLLDEPGLSLHPLAQRDLSAFFDGLAPTNQILYTTHSPFLVDADRLDRVRKVYVGQDGTTQASSDLRSAGADKAQAGATYAVYSALNLNVAESLLLGCTPVVVEGPSDQHYLTLIKVLLISVGKIAPTRELVFPPGGGTKTLRLTASILTGRDDKLPVVLLDGDSTGARMAKELSTSLYDSERDKVLLTDSFVGFGCSEVEDLIPQQHLAEAVDRIFRGMDQRFTDVVVGGKPVVPQIEAWAKDEHIELHSGWKVDVAKRAKSSMLSRGIKNLDPALVERWVTLFEAFDRFNN